VQPYRRLLVPRNAQRAAKWFVRPIDRSRFIETPSLATRRSSRTQPFTPTTQRRDSDGTRHFAALCALIGLAAARYGDAGESHTTVAPEIDGDGVANAIRRRTVHPLGVDLISTDVRETAMNLIADYVTDSRTARPYAVTPLGASVVVVLATVMRLIGLHKTVIIIRIGFYYLMSRR
jgi:hypothetical protein